MLIHTNTLCGIASCPQGTVCTVSLWNKVAKYHKAKTVSVQLASDPMTVFVPVYWYVCVCMCEWLHVQESINQVWYKALICCVSFWLYLIGWNSYLFSKNDKHPHLLMNEDWLPFFVFRRKKREYIWILHCWLNHYFSSSCCRTNRH